MRLATEQQRLFPATSSIEDMYRNTALDMLTSNVLQQAHNTAQIQVIKGEHGLGKSTFCRRLMLEGSQDLAIVLVTAARRTGIAEILHVVAGAKEDDTRAPLQVLAKNAAQRIYQQLYNNLQPVLLIDDAHCLSAQTLANLFRFQNAIAQQHTGGLKVVLVGERKIDSRLENVDRKVIERDRFLSSLLRPLTRNEVADYIDFKLARAQGDKPRLNKKQLQYVQRQSGGVPGRLEELYVRTLHGGAIGKTRALAAALVFILIAGGLAWHFELFDPAKLSELSGEKRRSARTKQTPQTPPPAPAQQPAPPAAIPEAAVEPAPAPDIGDATAAPAAEPSDSLAWLTEQPAEFYLIQLVGGRDPAKMENYRQSLKLPHPLTLHKTERNGQDWYLLFYGPFPDYESAYDARAQLPPDLRKNQPWIRQIGSILEKQ